MGDKDDPFGLSGEAGRTRIRPVRGAEPPRPPEPSRSAEPPRTVTRIADAETQQRADPWGPQPAADRWTGADRAASPPLPRPLRQHPNTLVAAFAALLELAPELERATPPGQPAMLRLRLQDALTEARDAAVGMGQTLLRANQATWFVAALLDDIALNTPWGGGSDWPRQPLVTGLTGDVDAGARFFEHLEVLLRHPNLEPQLLELGYLCLGLGFRGKYRVQPGGGESALHALRSQIARLLRDPEAQQAPLSPHWRGVVVADEPRRFTVPIWVLGLGTAALIAAIYTGLGLQLGGRTEQLYALAARLPPLQRAEIFRPTRNTTPPAAPITVDPAPAPVVLALLPEFSKAAPADRVAALRGREDVGLTILLVQGTDPELFRSAKAEVNEVYRPLIASIAAVLVENAAVIGKVTVIGHTDAVPVRRSNPFQSNQGLSEARARTIAGLLTAGGVASDLVTFEGRADSQPIADNATRDGQARNRRVEIKIEKKL